MWLVLVLALTLALRAVAVELLVAAVREVRDEVCQFDPVDDLHLMLIIQALHHQTSYRSYPLSPSRMIRVLTLLCR